MTRWDVERLDRLAVEHPDRESHRWQLREGPGGPWSVVKIALPPTARRESADVRAHERRPTPDTPCARATQNIRPLPGASGAVLAAGIPVALALTLLALVGCGEGLRDNTDAARLQVEGDVRERQVIDEDAATYRGVGFGDSRRKAVRTFGEVPEYRDKSVAPLGRPSWKIHSAPMFDCWTGTEFWRRPEWLLYEEVSFILSSGAICEFTVIELGAATKRGVAIGNSLAEAERAYPNLRCGIVDYGREEVVDLTPTCAGRLGPLPPGQRAGSTRREPGRWIWFGGDPIDTIQMNNRKFDVLPRRKDG